MRRILTLLILGFLPFAALAGSEWTFTDIEGKTHAPFESDTRALVLVFIATDCPIANYFQPTLRRLHEAYKDRGVRFILLHPDPDTTVNAAAKHAEEYRVTMPVVLDPEQRVAQRVKAEVTPEAFVIDRKGTIRYRGRINDTYVGFGKKRPAPTTHDVKDALDAVLGGRSVAVKRTRAIGCYLPELETKK